MAKKGKESEEEIKRKKEISEEVITVVLPIIEP